MKNVKIIVLRKGFYPDLIREHLTEPPEECVCDFFREGDQFLYTGGAEMPAGFCPWAWIDLYRSVSAPVSYTHLDVYKRQNEARYSSLTRAFPERAKELFAQNEEAAKERYEHLTRLVELYK